MSTLPPDDPARGLSWRARYDAARAEGVPLDPTGEPVDGVNAYPTNYAPDHLLVTSTEDLHPILDILRPAAADFGWGIKLQNLDRTPLEPEEAMDRASRGRRELDLPTIYRVQIFPQPSPDKDDQPVPPIDAWRLLQRARARLRGKKLRGVTLDHVLIVDPYGTKTNPYGTKTNPYGTKTNPYGTKTNPHGIDSYDETGSGGRQVVSYVGPAPVRQLPLARKGRRPVIAVLDTGCGEHPWLPDDIVTRYPEVDQRIIGTKTLATDPEFTGDLAGPFDGAIDTASGHGTFIAGIIRQVAPEADIISVRVADSQGNVLEGDFMLAVRSLVKWMIRPSGKGGGRQIDVINLSLGYYHETPEDDLFDRTLNELLVAARRHGCAVVCSAGNDATDRPSFPAALWRWGDEFQVMDPASAAPHLSVGALNPNGTVALFSNIGPWVSAYAPGASVLSASPPFNGGMQPSVRDDRGDVARETVDPDDYTGGFALWSGTSFAAPYAAAMLAAELAAPLMSGRLTANSARSAALRKAKRHVIETLTKKGVRRS